MKNKSTKLLISGLLLMAMLFSIALSGCGSPSNLEQYVKANDEVAKELDSYCSPGMTVDVSGNTLTFTYKYEQTFIEETAKLLSKELKNTLKMISPTYIAIRDKLAEETGFEDLSLVITYTDGEDNVLCTKEYKMNSEEK